MKKEELTPNSIWYAETRYKRIMRIKDTSENNTMCFSGIYSNKTEDNWKYERENSGGMEGFTQWRIPTEDEIALLEKYEAENGIQVLKPTLLIFN